MKKTPSTPKKPSKIAVYVGDMIDFIDQEAARDGEARKKRPSRSRVIRKALELLENQHGEAQAINAVRSE